MIRSYTELCKFNTFEERYRYLKLDGIVGKETFGYDRYLNQKFIKTYEWKNIRDYVITRDLGNDLGIKGHEIAGKILVHHMNPITKEEILHRDPAILDPEFLICTSLETHNAIHYGDESQLIITPTLRKPGDTKLW